MKPIKYDPSKSVRLKKALLDGTNRSRLALMLKLRSKELRTSTNVRKNKNLQPECTRAHSDFISAAEAALMLRMSSGTLANWRSSGKNDLPYHKNGARVLYTLQDIHDYLNRFKRFSTSKDDGSPEDFSQ